MLHRDPYLCVNSRAVWCPIYQHNNYSVFTNYVFAPQLCAAVTLTCATVDDELQRVAAACSSGIRQEAEEHGGARRLEAEERGGPAVPAHQLADSVVYSIVHLCVRTTARAVTATLPCNGRLTVSSLF